MVLQGGAGSFGQPRDILAVRTLAEQKWRPEILERGKFDADHQAGLLNVKQTERPPRLGHFTRRTHRPEQGALKLRIEDGGNVPDHAYVRLTAVTVPYRGDDRAARPNDPAHLRDGVCRVGEEMQDQHRKSAIEEAVLERQCTGVGLLEGNARIVVAGAREIEKTGSSDRLQ